MLFQVKRGKKNLLIFIYYNKWVFIPTFANVLLFSRVLFNFTHSTLSNFI